MATYKPKPWNWNLGLLGHLAGHPVAASDLTGNPKPFRPQLTPGMYDPQLDFQGQSEQQGFNFTTQDKGLGDAQRHESVYGTQGSFDGQDFTTQGLLGALQQRSDRGLQDYTTSSENLQRNYRNLGEQQTGSAEAAGVAEGGARQQSQTKRADNFARDEGVLDTNWRRFQEDIGRERASGLYQLMTGQQGSDLQFSHAQQAHDLFAGPGGQLDQAKFQSAAQMGTLPTSAPPGTFVEPGSSLGHALGVEGGTFGGVPYQRDQFGNLRPVRGFSPTAQSAMASHSLLGTGFATGRPPRRRRR